MHRIEPGAPNTTKEVVETNHRVVVILEVLVDGYISVVKRPDPYAYRCSTDARLAVFGSYMCLAVFGSYMLMVK